MKYPNDIIKCIHSNAINTEKRHICLRVNHSYKKHLHLSHVSLFVGDSNGSSERSDSADSRSSILGTIYKGLTPDQVTALKGEFPNAFADQLCNERELGVLDCHSKESSHSDSFSLDSRHAIASHSSRHCPCS